MSRDTPARIEISQCSLNAWLNGLASGDYRRLTGSDGLSFCVSARSFIGSFVCRLKRVLVGHWPDWPSSAGGHERL